LGKDLPFDPLDPQRDRVYTAEANVWPKDPDVHLPLDELREKLDAIQSATWFKRVCPNLPRKIVLKDGRGSNWSRGGWGTIHLIKMSRTLDVLVHEIVHNIIPCDVEWHGPVFAGMLLYMTGKVWGKKYKEKLRLEFGRQNVVYDPRLSKYGKLGDVKLTWASPKKK